MAEILTTENLGISSNTSQITYDGTTVINYSVAGIGLNDNLKGIDDELGSQQAQITALGVHNTKTSELTDYDGIPTFTCFALTANAPLNTIIDELGTQICLNTTNIAALIAIDIDYSTLPFNADPYPVGPAVANVQETFTAIDSAIQSFETDKEEKTDAIEKFLAVTSDFRMSGGTVTGISTLSAEIASAIYLIGGEKITKIASSKTVTTLKDSYITYRTGTTNYIVTAVANGAPQPVVATGDILIAKVVTDATDIISIDNSIADEAAIDGINIKDNAILSSNFADGSILSDKLANSGVAAGTFAFANVTVTDAGILTAASSEVDLTALADEEFLKFDSTASKWKNVALLGGILPSGAANDDVLTFNTSTTQWESKAPIAFTAIPLAGTTAPITGNLEVATGVKIFIGTTDMTWDSAGLDVNGDTFDILTTNARITSELALAGEVHFEDIGAPPTVPLTGEIIAFADDISGVGGTMSLFLLSEDDTKIVLGTRTGIGTHTPDVSAMFEVQSTTKGALFPRLTTTERNAIPSPATSLFLFNTTLAKYQFFNGTSWTSLDVGGAANPGGVDTQIQFNDGGAFGGDSDFVWDNITKSLVLGGVAKAKLGGGELDLRNGGVDNTVALSTDNGSFAEGFVLIDSTSVELGFGGGAVPDIFMDATKVTIVSGNVGGHRIDFVDAVGITIGTSASQKVAAFGVTPIVRPTVTGSRGGNAALASFLTEMTNLGWIIDSTTA